ncbi:MAG: hypothetical protein E6Q66_10490 [Pedobacter sp.]|nr:MAG: hypothetical protein E6Q66_10490 [Pedobacter sp.]
MLEKIFELELLLQKRNNGSSAFFKKLLEDLKNGLKEDVVNSILKSYAIVQYGDFNHQEEKLFDEIWEIADKLKNS